MEAPLYNIQGTLVGKTELLDSVFGAEVKLGLIHRLLRYQLSNARIAIAHTKTRGTRSGSTRKLYKQKGTGRARAGASGSPTRKKGGVAFGPHSDQNYTLLMNKKERRAALISLLSSKAAANQLKVIEQFSPESEKTKNFANIVKNMEIASGLVAATPTEKSPFVGGKNLKNVKTILVGYLNPKDLLKYKDLIITKGALSAIEATYNK